MRVNYTTIEMKYEKELMLIMVKCYAEQLPQRPSKKEIAHCSSGWIGAASIIITEKLWQ